VEPWIFALATSQRDPHGVTPATTEYGRSGPRREVTDSFIP
jgi:hypothetical protein